MQSPTTNQQRSNLAWFITSAVVTFLLGGTALVVVFFIRTALGEHVQVREVTKNQVPPRVGFAETVEEELVPVRDDERLLEDLLLELDKPEAVSLGAFSHVIPSELQFSCVVSFDPVEEKLAQHLIEGNAEERLTAAEALWRAHSRKHAADVLKFVDSAASEDEPYRAFLKDVHAAVKVDAVLREMRDGDYQWGTWLAFLRPQKEYVHVLLAALQDQPKHLPETMLALGNSRDARALQPLLELLESEDSTTRGDAAEALGYLGKAEAEFNLIQSLEKDDIWLQVNACGALAKIGTRRSLPALEKLASDNRYTGALNVRRSAKSALDRIKKREM